VYEQAFGQINLNYWLHASGDGAGSLVGREAYQPQQQQQEPPQLDLTAAIHGERGLKKLCGSGTVSPFAPAGGGGGGGSSSSSSSVPSVRSHYSGSPDENGDPTHSCLAHAAAILAEIRTDSTTMDLMWASSGGPPNAEASAREVKNMMGDVIFANRRVVDQATAILECTCINTDYQIAVLISLIWFHMIDRYAKAAAAAAATARRGPGHNHVIGSVQVLVGELQRLSPAIDKLSIQDPGISGRGGLEAVVVGISAAGFKQLKGELASQLANVYAQAEAFLHHIPR
jgi:hypothetical protein